MKKKQFKYKFNDLQKKAFRVEKKRQILASGGKLNILKREYRSSLPEIRNLNTSAFWDERINYKTNHVPPDGMTRDRIRIAYKFLPKSSRRILDIGAGYGYIERLFNKNKDLEIFGNDISPNAIENLKKRFKGSFKVESLYKMRYRSGFFDAVLMLEVLEHVPPSKTFQVLRSVKRILKKGGYFILSVPTNEGLERMDNNPSGHVRMYTEALIEAELKIVGFEVLSLKTLYAFNNLYFIKKIISKVLKNRWKPNDIIVLAKSL